MTQHTLPELFGIDAETLYQDVVIQVGEVTYEGRLVAIDGDDLTLEDCTPTTANDVIPPDSGRHVVTLSRTSQVWLDLHEDDFTTDETGAVTLPYDSTIGS
jgi:hypothetical protein